MEPAKLARTLRLAAFASPGAPLLALSVPPIVFLPPYYTQYLGLDAGTVGAIFLLARVFDLVINPTIGGLQDRTRTAWGARRAWLIGATPLVMLAVWFAFIGLQPGVSSLVVGLAVLSLYSTFASAMIAHLGWAGELRPDYHGRTQVLGAVQIASTIGQVFVMALPAIVETTGIGDFEDGVRMMGWAIIAFLPLTVLMAVLTNPEPLGPPRAKLGFGAAFAAMRSNDALRRVLVPDFLLGVTQGVAGTLFIFFAREVLDLRDQATTLLFVYFATGLAGAPLWVWLARKLGKHRALQISCLWWAVALALVPLAPRGDVVMAGIGMALAGVPAVAATLLLRAMMADVVDEDDLATGQPRSGLFFGLLLTTTKIGLALGPASLILLAPFGFSGARGAENPPEALLALSLLFAGLPMALNLVAAWSLQGYPLDEKRQSELRAALNARGEAQS